MSEEHKKLMVTIDKLIELLKTKKEKKCKNKTK